MKRLLLVGLIGFFHSIPATAASNVGQCVFPKYDIQKNGNLKFKKPVPIYSAADVKSSSTTLTTLTAYSIAKESNGLVQLVEVPGTDGSNPRAGKAIGWAKLSDFSFQELRNCN
jgi:hypothetical protein